MACVASGFYVLWLGWQVTFSDWIPFPSSFSLKYNPQWTYRTPCSDKNQPFVQQNRYHMVAFDAQCTTRVRTDASSHNLRIPRRNWPTLENDLQKFLFHFKWFGVAIIDTSCSGSVRTEASSNSRWLCAQRNAPAFQQSTTEHFIGEWTTVQYHEWTGQLQVTIAFRVFGLCFQTKCFSDIHRKLKTRWWIDKPNRLDHLMPKR